MTTHCVYWIRTKEHKDPMTQGYIGVSVDFEKRMHQHEIRMNDCEMLQRAKEKHGWNNLIKSIIVIGEKDYCYLVEKKFRPEKRIGWNILPGGGEPPSWEGKSHTEATKIKMSINNCNNNPEVRAKKALALTGRKFSEETIGKLIVAAKERGFFKEFNKTKRGIKLSEEIKKNMSIGMLNAIAANPNMRQSQWKSVKCVETGVVYKSVTDAAKWLRSIGFDKCQEGAISGTCLGKRKTAYGYTWVYA